MPREPRKTSRGSSRSPTVQPSSSLPSEGSTELKAPLIRWDKDCAVRTTRLIQWFKENETARLKVFSDSTKDAKDGNRKKEVSGHSRNYYYQAAAQAIFAEDTSDEVRHLASIRPDIFVQKIDRRIKELRKAYNAANKKLGQTGLGVTYEELQCDPSKKNIIESIVASFPWWPDLHGFWRTNPAYNITPGTADPDQDFVGDAFAMFKLGNTGSGPNSGAESDSVGSLFNRSHSNSAGPLLLDTPSPALPDAGDGFSYDSIFNFDGMDIDNAFQPCLPPPPVSGPSGLPPSAFMSSGTASLSSQNTSTPPLYPSSGSDDLLDTHWLYSRRSSRPSPSTSMPPPNSLSLRDLSLSMRPPRSQPNSGSEDQDMSLPPGRRPVGHLPPQQKSRSPVPFSFRGGAPCIIPQPAASSNVILLNSDDEDSTDPESLSRFVQRHTGKTSHFDLRPNSSQPHSDLQHDASTPPTSVQGDVASAGSSSHQSLVAKGKRAQRPSSSSKTEPLAKANDLLSKGTDLANMVGTLSIEKARRREAHYQNKVAERDHEVWMARHQKEVEELKLQQLERELELEKLRRGI